ECVLRRTGQRNVETHVLRLLRHSNRAVGNASPNDQLRRPLTLTRETSMRHIAVALVAALALQAAPSFAQLPAPSQSSQQVRDPAMVVVDRGQKLEMFATLRASPEVMSGGRVVAHRVNVARADAPFGPKALGVVYNHTLQVQGFLTGEVTF